MEFYIGGYAQGKLAYVLNQHQGQETEVIDGADMINTADTDIIIEHTGDTGNRLILNHLHLLVKNLLEHGYSPEQYVRELIKAHPDCIIICDEIGNGIVPLLRQEREYRERLGRIQIELAARAESVERVICGLGQKLK